MPVPWDLVYDGVYDDSVVVFGVSVVPVLFIPGEYKRAIVFVHCVEIESVILKIVNRIIIRQDPILDLIF